MGWVGTTGFCCDCESPRHCSLTADRGRELLFLGLCHLRGHLTANTESPPELHGLSVKTQERCQGPWREAGERSAGLTRVGAPTPSGPADILLCMSAVSPSPETISLPGFHSLLPITGSGALGVGVVPAESNASTFTAWAPKASEA